MPIDEPNNRVAWAGSLIALAAVLIALLGLRVFRGEDVAGFSGGTTYGRIADNLREHGLYSIDGEHPTGYRPPAYPLLLAACRQPHDPHSQPWALAVNLLLNAACLALLLLLVQHLSNNPKAMLLAGLLFASDIAFHQEAMAQRETMLYTAFLLIFMLAAARRHVSFASLLMMSMATGLAWLTRPTGIALIPLLLLSACFQSKHRSIGIRMARVVTAGCLFTAIILPWQAFLYRSFHAPVLAGTTSGGLNLYQGNNPATKVLVPWVDVDKYVAEIDRRMENKGLAEHDELARDQWLKAHAIQYMREHPTETLRMAFIKTIALFSPLPTPLGNAQIDKGDEGLRLSNFEFHHSIWTILATIHGIALLTLLVLAVARRNRVAARRPRAVTLIVGYVLIVTLLHAITFAETRFRLPLDPMLIALGATAVFGPRHRTITLDPSKA